MNGFVKMKQPKKPNGTKYTGVEFCGDIQNYPFNYPQRIFAHIGGHHVISIIDGIIYDSWNSSHGCIGNYYV
jgi:hypothetical protein